MTPPKRRSLRSRFARRLAEIERERPDGAISTWRWMWRALERSSSSPWRLRARFGLLVAWDAATLAAWYLTRMLGRIARRPRAGMAAVAVVAALSGLALWVHEQPHRPRMPVAEIAIAANGVLTVQGQAMSLDDFEHVADHYRISVAQVTVAPDAKMGLVHDVTNVLTTSQANRVRIVVPATDWQPRRREGR